MRKALPFLMLAAFLALLLPRMLQSIGQSTVYPEWSTMRSDPLGTKVLYLALERMEGLRVERNFQKWEDLRPRRALYMMMGVSPLLLKESDMLKKLASGGGVVVLALRPATVKAGSRTESLGFLHLPETGLELRSADWKCLAGERRVRGSDRATRDWSRDRLSDPDSSPFASPCRRCR